jgi:protein-S-isoprenylcysteine O-methyltransferase Ste14
MMLSEVLNRQGVWLFRWRSYLPLAIFLVLILAYNDYSWFAATFSNTFEDRWDFACLAVALSGLALRLVTVGFVPSGTSGRTTSQHAAVHNTTGLYSIVRHPLYVGNFLILLGYALTLKSALFALFETAARILYYERIILAEEVFLESTHGEEFRQWAMRTPTVFPSLRLWVAPALPFSWRTALLREYHGLMLIAVTFFTIKLIEGLAIRHMSARQWLDAEPFYVAMLLACTALYLVVRLIRKRTQWLEVAGRGP